ncbi:hypothetical protein E4T56_gene17979 [Termitomyces sp. T112]|nr:hypothetical protein E4T56_gene17979 [Termitomyces sp. T112]
MKECDRLFPEWTDEHQRAFDEIKRIVTSAECLTVIDYEDPTKKIFVTTNTILFDEWYCENGLMDEIISDRDHLFIAEVWKELHKLTGVKLKMSTSYHPEMDGGSKRTNKTVVQAIRYHVDRNQKGWKRTLPHIRFTIMNTVSTLTEFSPFQLKTGRSPQVIPPLAPLPEGAMAEMITACKIVAKLEADVKEVQDNLLVAKIQQVYHANKHRAPEDEYQKGKKRVTKFMPRNDGPYEVIATFPECSEYTLRLPNSNRSFPGFHASLLKRHIPNNPALFPNREYARPGPVVTEDGAKDQYLIEKIIDAQQCRRGKQYLVRWVGYGPDHDEWLPGVELEDCEALDAWEAENRVEV